MVTIFFTEKRILIKFGFMSISRSMKLEHVNVMGGGWSDELHQGHGETD